MNTIEKLKEIGATFHISAAGGGTITISNICSASGRSSVILGASFINDMDMFNKYIHVDSWSKYASYESAKELSVISQEFGKNGNRHFGIGIACSLAANNEREGRVNLANIVITGYNFEISKSIKFNYVGGFTDDRRHAQEHDILRHTEEMIGIAYEFIRGNVPQFGGYMVKFLKQTKITEDSITIYPGSFNPIHDAHRYLKILSETLTSTKTIYEISIVNFDKKRINFEELNKRIELIGDDILVSYDKTFVEKYNNLIKNYPHLKRINFVCGIDTWDRIDKLDISKLSDTGKVKFIVFGRNGKWLDSYLDLTVFGDILYQDEKLRNYNNPLSSSQIKASKV